jgi:DNA (cytosine-5)-methyltransferase 1
VLAHRFPAVPNLGDMTQIHNSEHFNGNSIDILVGGTPCQSFSVAGLRKGLDDTRGQLMLTFCELAARKRPRWVVWENVPGVLSSNKGEDLASFLGLLTGREIHPPVGGWKNSGVVEGIGSAYGVAWTVLDAQYFGVAQRRRRVFAIGYLGDWRPAAAVLFEYHRLSGDIKKSREKRKATSADAQGGVGGGGIPRIAQTLSSRDHKGPSCGRDGLVGNPIAVPKSHAFKVGGGSETETGEQGGTPGKKAGKGYLGSDELAFTIGTTQDQQIAQPIPIHDQATRHSGKRGEHQDGKGNGMGIGNPGDPMNTLTKGDHHAVAQPIAVDCYNQTINEHTTQTIGSSASDVNHYGAVLTPQAVDFRNQNLSEDVTMTLQSKSNGGYSLNYQPGVLQPNISPTITQCKGSRGGSSMEALDEVTAIYAQQPTMAIRRLTPTECERLQGFHDGWTKIPYRNKPEEVCPDGPRYKACGNSMAVPVMRWIGQRIQMVEDILKQQNDVSATIPQL